MHYYHWILDKFLWPIHTYCTLCSVAYCQTSLYYSTTACTFSYLYSCVLKYCLFRMQLDWWQSMQEPANSEYFHLHVVVFSCIFRYWRSWISVIPDKSFLVSRSGSKGNRVTEHWRNWHRMFWLWCSLQDCQGQNPLVRHQTTTHNTPSGVTVLGNKCYQHWNSGLCSYRLYQ